MKNTFIKISAVVLVLMICCFAIVSCTALKDKTDEAEHTEDTAIGTGSTEFIFEVEHLNGSVVKFTVKTDKTILSDALLENNLISGDNGAYGLYVKTVDGVTYDYDTDRVYWALYVDGSYALSGVDSQTIEAGHTYKFKAER